jgi:SH3-like domain-containing protein
MSRRHMAHILVLCLALSATLVLRAPSVTAGESEPAERLPRFVSLRSDQVNLRVGPGESYPIQWVLTHKEMPVEIIKEFEHWRMIHDWQGDEGWVHERMVTGKRTVVVKGGVCALHRQPDLASGLVARAEPGVFAHLLECRGVWCRIEAASITGWVQRNAVWGVYPDEAVQ